MTQTIPLTVIGGFLGAGKTTLLNNILAGSHGVRYAVLVNDFGDLAIDGRLVREHGGDTVTFANGCVCCTLGDNFMLTLDRLLSAQQPPQQILVEASGVADPRSIADIAVLHPQLRRDLILILAEAQSIRARGADERLSDTVQRQLAAADLIVLNKCDLVDGARLEVLRRWLGGYTQAALIETRYAQLPVALLSGDPNLRQLSQPASAAREPHHHQSFSAVTLTLDYAFNIGRLHRQLAGLPRTVLRVKGFVSTAQTADRLQLVQVSGGTVDISVWSGPADGITPALVFIGTADMPDTGELKAMLAVAADAG